MAFALIWASTLSSEKLSSSASSSKEASASPVERFPALSCLIRLRHKFLVILPTYAFRLSGLCGGMEFQALSQVSFRHSSRSSKLARMFPAIFPQYR